MKRSREPDDHDDNCVAVDDHEFIGSDDPDAELAALRDYLMHHAQKGKFSKAAAESIIDKITEPEQPEPMLKRPLATSVADDSELPDQPPLKTRFAAIHYKSCRIYWGGDRTYRVLYKPTAATKIVHWKTHEGAAEVWCNVIGFCIEHAH